MPSSPKQQNLVEQLLAEIEALKDQNDKLSKENEALRKQVCELIEKLKTNSRNSSRSPSQDPYRKRKGKGKPSEKKQGAQEGHQGRARAKVPLEEVTEVKEVRPEKCPRCGGCEFANDPIRTEERQVTELPEIRLQVTQFNIHTHRCNDCGCGVKADIPSEAGSAFGPRLKGLICVVSSDLGLTKRKITHLMGYLNIRISLGTVCNIHHEAGKILEGPYADIREHTLQQSALHADETSWYRKGKRQWLWVVTGTQSAFFKIDPSRSTAAFQRIMGDAFHKPPLTTDRYGAYNSYEGPRQSCWSHLDRDFQKIAERDGVDSLIGKRLKEEADEVFFTWHCFLEGHLTRQELQDHIQRFTMPCVKALIQLGSVGQECHPKTRGTCKRLLADFDTFWTYLFHENVEPTNNLAERDLRPSVIQRKLSYGTQSDAGEAFVERALSVVVTLKKQAKDVFGYLTSCFQAHARDAPIPSPL